jgi:hypothetical protein
MDKSTPRPWRAAEHERLAFIRASFRDSSHATDEPAVDFLLRVMDVQTKALEEMLIAFSMQNIGVTASLRRTNAKKQARAALALATKETP